MAGSSKKNPMEVLRLRVQDFGGELEKIRVQALRKIAPNPPKKISVKDGSAVKTVEIKLSLPHFHVRSGLQKTVKAIKKTSVRSRLIALSSLVIIIIAIIGLTGRSAKTAEPTAIGSKNTVPKPVYAVPPFSTILPAGKSASVRWIKIPRSDGGSAYVYTDVVNKSSLRISEQPLPNNFKADPTAKVAQLAQNFNAGDKFNAANTTVYVATESDGSQYVILSLNNLLILISSSSALTNNQWAAYIASLH